jgi:hypothetical protein
MGLRILQQATQEKELILLREVLRREMAARIAVDSLHRYGGRHVLPQTDFLSMTASLHLNLPQIKTLRFP